MILSKNIYGMILSKEYIGDHNSMSGLIEYKIEHKKRLYTIYTPNNGRFDFDVKQVVYMTYKKENILWGKNKAILASADVGEIVVKAKKRFIINDLIDTAALFAVIQVISLIPTPEKINSFDQFFIAYNILLALLLFIMYTIFKFIKAIENNNMFFGVFNKQRAKDQRLMKYRSYVKNNFSIKDRAFNKKLTEDERNDLKIFVQKEEENVEDRILISSITDKPKITLKDINNIDYQKIKKEIEIKNRVYAE